MWKWLHPYAKPETQYHLCGKFSPFFAILTALLLTVGIVWGIAFAPADYQQGNSFRIMYVHVPMAIWSMGVYGSMAVAALCPTISCRLTPHFIHLSTDSWLLGATASMSI